MNSSPCTGNDPESVRQQVSRAYQEVLVEARDQQGCCDQGPTSAGTPDCAAGYETEAERYGEQLATSFGCGNPLALAGIQPGQTVLDLGSGAGLDLLIASDRVGPTGRVLGVDLTDAMLEAARDAARRAGKQNIELRKGIIEELPVEDASVDWVISNCVINLSPEKERVFAEIQRVLRPGGSFSVSDIVVEDPPDWLVGQQKAWSSCIAGALCEADYLRGLAGAGLIQVEAVERATYDRAWIESSLSGATSCSTSCDRLDPHQLDQLEGRVHSVRFTGRRPG